jgi:hypothetical protein
MAGWALYQHDQLIRLTTTKEKRNGDPPDVRNFDDHIDEFSDVARTQIVGRLAK